jgi:hypothetical protein
MMMQDTPDIQQLNQQARMEGLAATQRRQGKTTKADQIQDLLELNK